MEFTIDTDTGATAGMAAKPLQCENCRTELREPAGPGKRRFHANGTYACPPFDEDGASIPGTVAAPQPQGAEPVSIFEGSLDVGSRDGQAELARHMSEQAVERDARHSAMRVSGDPRTTRQAARTWLALALTSRCQMGRPRRLVLRWLVYGAEWRRFDIGGR